jgi:hypothetical protein
MAQHRFRTGSEGELVLQVYVQPVRDSYSYGHERSGTWRDATVADIPVADPFAQPAPAYAISYNPETGDWAKQP